MDYKLELIGVPVTDVDRAIEFYTEKCGFNLDHDHTVSDEIRFVQVTPPGSACSIAFGKGVSEMEPGSLDGLQSWSRTPTPPARSWSAAGVEASEVDEQPWGRFVYFKDPDGNGWSIQQIVTPGG